MGHQCLVLDQYCMSPEKARKYVLGKLLALGLEEPIGGWATSVLTLGSPDKPQSLAFIDMISKARKTGHVTELSREIDSKDPYFGGTFQLAASGEFATITMNYGPYHRELKGPARFQPVEIELGNDILLARECACAHSDPHDFSETCRHFRLYLLASIALIEAYLNRYALLAPTGLPLQEKLDTLRNSQRFDERIITWMEIFTDSTFASVSATSEYDSFVKLKRLRNDLVHSSEPFLGYRLKDMAMQLNLCRKGVGGFLSKLHLLSGREPLSFMDKLVTAPRITYAKEHK